MACKDCIYSLICKMYADFGVTDVPYDEGDTCEMFKNKTDFVEVVRCKDCKWCIINKNHPAKPLICVMTKMCGTTKPEWFCAAGERKEGAEE